MEPLTPRRIRPVPPPLGAYFRAGWSDHHQLEQIVPEGRPSLAGIVFDAYNGDRHRDLREEVRRRNLEAVLDPRAMELATEGGFGTRAHKLPWAGKEPHTREYLAGSAGAAMVETIAELVEAHTYNAVLAPTHLISSTDDPWLEIDSRLATRLRRRLDEGGQTKTLLYYPLAVPGRVFRDSQQRQRLISALRPLEVDAIWLRIYPFGTRNSGPLALHGYIEACRDLHEFNLPIVAERTGTVGVALLAFGAASGVESGVTIGEDFEPGRWKRPPEGTKKRFPAPRVYIPEIGAFLKRPLATKFFAHRQMKAKFGCRNSDCCRHGAEDMIRAAPRHFLVRRLDEIGRLSRVPEHLRPGYYLEDFLRPATDRAVLAARFEPSLDPIRQRLESWRVTLSELDQSRPASSFAPPPQGFRIQHRRGA